MQCDTPTATHLYRIAQEAINNAVKHSGARNLFLRLNGGPDGIILEIRDDGKWLRPKPSRRSGMGRHIMDYRAQLIGGTVRCQGDDCGTVVTCQIPRSFRPDDL